MKEKRTVGGVVSSKKKKKLVGGDDSGLGADVGSTSMTSDTGGSSLLVQASSGAPRLATKVLNTTPKSKISQSFTDPGEWRYYWVHVCMGGVLVNRNCNNLLVVLLPSRMEVEHSSFCVNNIHNGWSVYKTTV